MINYELLLLLRVMPKPETKQVLHRVAEQIFDKGGIIRKLENLGTRRMPYKTSSHGIVHHQASYFLLEFNAPPSSLHGLADEYVRDVDIIRKRIYKQVEREPFECTLHDEMQPAPYRKDVQDLIATTKKSTKPRFSYNSGLDYYPFGK
ncbi:probable 28S ribosomal protein S6, mitochondrial [Sitophilus oryzae]|uniref:Small ribosomal subunit protein bS6m n=1 Tax=Sitophilus oryzae TaxID=7048 RepID=A0A6J2Y379_SITOR|nr:probable 28S ribosomal protein S6, mitochondrial [Sitophilus oryzae]